MENNIPPQNQIPQDSFQTEISQKSSKAWMIIAFVAILALVVSLVFGYMQIKKLNDEITSQKAQISDLQNTKKTLEDAAKAAATAVTKTVTTPTDSEAIKTAAINYQEAMVGQKNGQTFTIEAVTINKTNSNFATAGVQGLTNGKPDTGGASMVLKKVNGNWVVVFAGQNADAEVNKMFGIPTN